MIERGSIREHMEVIGADGAPVGRVDGIEGDRLKLTRDSAPDGEHHYVPMSEVERVDAHVHPRSSRAAVLGGAAAV